MDDCLRIAERDLETAGAIRGRSPEWAFNIAYNAMHQAGRAFLFYHGCRAVGEARHGTVVRFLEIGLGAEYEETLMVMDRMRRKRNRATYDRVGTISRTETDEAISTARAFVREITLRVKPEGA